MPAALSLGNSNPLFTGQMEITPRRHELISCLLLGIGTLFMYLGYHTQSFISETIIRSVHTKDPERISAFAGYYGYVCCIIPYIKSILSDKLSTTRPSPSPVSSPPPSFTTSPQSGSSSLRLSSSPSTISASSTSIPTSSMLPKY